MSGKLTYHERARKAAAARWGPRRTVHLGKVDPDTARLIRALLAQNEKTAAPTDDRAAVVAEGHADDSTAA